MEFTSTVEKYVVFMYNNVPSLVKTGFIMEFTSTVEKYVVFMYNNVPSLVKTGFIMEFTSTVVNMLYLCILMSLL